MRRHGVRYRYLVVHASGVELAELAELIDAGTLVPVIDRVGFEEIEATFAYLENRRTKGKIVLRMG